ncbi:MAG: oligosaccharide flippase family protein [Acidimicrobiales bacterium]
MSTTSTRWSTVVERTREHLADPLRRDSYALILGSALTSVIGVVFWVAAARLYSERDLGVASTLIATMGFLANLATLGLRNGLIRFLPTSRSGTERLIHGSFLACGLTAAVAAVVFLVGQPVWGKQLGMLRDNLGVEVFFVVATVAWVIFVLQDSVLTGVHLATWVPVENAAYSLTKLALLVVLASFPRWGLFVAWTVPAVAFLVPVNVMMLRRIRASASAVKEQAADPPPMREIVRFAAGDHTASFLWLAATELLTLVVLSGGGAAASAYYYLSFTIAYSLYLVTANVSSAFVVAASSRPDEEATLTRNAVVQAARLVVPSALAGCVVAPWVLRVFGPGYERHSVTLLRLLLLSAIPQIVVGLSIGRARVHQRVSSVIVINLVTSATLFPAAALGLHRWGVVAVGWAWLVTQTVLAAFLAPTLLSTRRTPRSPIARPRPSRLSGG